MSDKKRVGRYPVEVRERAVRMVREHEHEYPSQWKAIQSISKKLGVNHETLRIWVRRAETDAGERPGLTTDERVRMRQLEKENKEIKDGKAPEDWDQKKRAHKDTEARWTKKGDERHYGYKNHAKVARKTKFIDDYEVSDASVHDSHVFESLLDADTDSDVWADSAYRSAESIAMLKSKEIVNHVHERAYRNRPLNDVQKERNTSKSRTRARVEHVFGFQAITGADRLRTIGIRRARRGIGIANLVYNLFRFKQLNYAMA